MGTHRKIVIRSYGDIVQLTQKVSGTPTPGHLLEFTSTADLVQAHSTAGQNALPMFLKEDSLVGGEIGTAAVSGAQVQAIIFRRGDEVNALIKNGENIAIGDLLESAGDGTLEKVESDSAGIEHTQSIIGQAMEAVDMTDSSGADPTGRCRVKIW